MDLRHEHVVLSRCVTVSRDNHLTEVEWEKKLKETWAKGKYPRDFLFFLFAILNFWNKSPVNVASFNL